MAHSVLLAWTLRLGRHTAARATRSFSTASSSPSAVDQMIEYALGQQKSNPDMAVDILRSGLSYPNQLPADTARLHLALARTEAGRDNWVVAAAAAVAAAGRLAAALGPDPGGALRSQPELADAVAALGLWRACSGQQGAAEAALAAAGEAEAAAAAAEGAASGEALVRKQHHHEVEAEALAGRAQLQMWGREWGPAEELLGSALKAAEAAHGERSPALASLLLLLGYTYSRSARVTFAEGLFREAAKLLRLDPARQQQQQQQQCGGAHASVGAVLAWRYAQLLWVLPNRGNEAAVWERCARHLWGGCGPLGSQGLEAVLGGQAHLKGEGPEGAGLLLSTRLRRALPLLPAA
ncbi:hypothetical protein TSOC_009171 [Tetrabaena socialis]|uniref:Uncharacterized protein n=1 Tax=Tetrabaena socialis TaxID=47790 RepID=A0A2J7ZWL6_9CHLO|nr:hypothetical protein TSOC_009171 [Tetrabaena socialis]|eukprot:PNH04649.1 hypothetical protein TSOC_009171 [Tetrabaena socialis]